MFGSLPQESEHLMKQVLLVVALLCLAVGCALAAPTVPIVNMDFIAPGGPNANGEYTYPYLFTVNGNPDKLMCISFLNSVSGGQTWQAYQYLVPQLEGTGNGHGALKEVAWLFQQEKANNNDPALNWAAWAITDPGLDLTAVPGAADWLAQAQSQTFTKGEFDDVYVYVPTTWGNDGAPQVFLGSTPEPSTLMMLGSSALGIVGLLRRKLLK